MSATPEEGASQPEELSPGAEYGCQPFDQFILEQWDYTRPVPDDQDQWDEIAKKWLSMTSVERNPYWVCGLCEVSPPPGAPFLPTQDQINRVLAPHQTTKERNLLKHIMWSDHEPIWLRTCYAADLASTFAEMKADAYNCDDNPMDLFVLDDEALYGDPGDDWSRIFFRLPSLPADLPVGEGELFPNRDMHAEFPCPSERERPIWEAFWKDRQIIFLLDREALTERLIKMMYIDIHGNAVWWNRIAVEDMEIFNGIYFKGSMLPRIRERFADDERELLVPGAVLPFDE